MSSESKISTSKIAILTGGGRGLGKSIVLNLAKRGIVPIFTYNASHDEAMKLVASIEETGGKAIALQLNTGKVKTFDEFVKSVRAALADLGAERFDYLVNNAGISYTGSFENTTEEELDNLYSVNFKGVYFLTQKLLPVIRDGGSIVNIATGLTRFWIPDKVPYASLKGAIDVFTHYLAKELGERRINVNSVAPGAMETDFSNGMIRDNPKYNKFVAGLTALGRVGLPEDVAPMIISLLSDENHWVNAQRIEVSGGMVL